MHLFYYVSIIQFSDMHQKHPFIYVATVKLKIIFCTTGKKPKLKQNNI